MSKTTLKKQLKELTREQLIEVMLELYDARKDAREYLEYYVNPDEKKMHEKYKAVITKEFFRKRKSEGAHVGLQESNQGIHYPAPESKVNSRPPPVARRGYLPPCRFVKRMDKRVAGRHRLNHVCRHIELSFANDILEEYRRRIDDLLALTQRLRGPLRTLKDAYAKFNDSMK